MRPLGTVRTHLPGLDQVLGGGLLESGVYFVQGGPGTGKTTLANHLAFLHLQHGGSVLYLTLLAESHARMMQHMLGQAFFDPAAVGNRIAYVSGYRELEGGNLKSVISLLRAELTRQKASLLVLDGLVLPSATAAEEDARLKEFVHELQSLATLLGCNVLLLTSGRGRSVAAEQTMVDGIFALEDRAFGSRNERLFEVSKFRGGAPLRGKHSFCITDDGVRIFPRLESVLPEHPGPMAPGVLSSGLADYDALFFAGAPRAGTATLVQGGAGTGKTLLGLQFLRLCDAAAPGVLLAFNEEPEVLAAMARGVGLDLQAQFDRGDVEAMWCVAARHALDQLGQQLLSAVDRRRARRVVIDTVAGFAATAMFGERGYAFVCALAAELRRRGVTTLVLCDPDALAAEGVGHVAPGLRAAFDQVVQLGAEPRSGLRTLQVRKARGQRFDGAERLLHIDEGGLALTGRAQ